MKIKKATGEKSSPASFNFKISPLAHKTVNRMIFLSGSARSGTTIIGKLIHTAKEVEYAFEPPTLFALMPLIERIEEHQWKMIFETFCYEDLFLGNLAGRTINFNTNDDSCIYNVKSKAEIKERLSRSFSKKELEKLANKHILSVKVPDVIPFLPRFAAYYPSARIVVINRGANEVLNSLIKKGWFDDVSEGGPDLIWPYRIYKGCKIPHWADENDADWWCRANHLERTAYYYIRTVEPLESIPEKILVNYNTLLESPERTVMELFGKLSITFTEKTREVLSTVSPTIAERQELLQQLPAAMRDSIRKLEEKYL